MTIQNLAVEKSIIKTICSGYGIDLEYTGAKEYLNKLSELLENENDFCFEIENMEFRIIDDSYIWDIYVEEIRNIVEDCYDLKLDKLPSFLAFEINWDATAENCYVDGYGHTFATYDHSESEACTNNSHYWIFRTN